MRSISVFLYCFFTSLALCGQQPAYFICGEDQFKGLKIYDIIQDRSLNYWIATNEGLFYFDHYQYERVDCSDSKSSAVFNFVENKQGTIYCHNLNNQIFELKEKSCRLFYELTKEEASSDLSLCIAPDDGLLVGGRKILHLSVQGKIKNRVPVNFYLGPPFTDASGNIYYQLGGSDSILVWWANGLTPGRYKLTNAPAGKDNVLQFFKYNKESYALDMRVKKLYRFFPDSLLLKPLSQSNTFERGGSTRLYFTQQHVWVAGTLNGVWMLGEELKSESPRLFYEDYFISKVYQDKESNILLGTFDKGILVVPDLGMPDVIHSFKEDPVTAMDLDARGTLYLGTSKGALLQYQNNAFITICQKGKRSIEGIYRSSRSNLVIFDNGLIRAYHAQNKDLTEIGDASLKDAAIVNSNLFYLGTNRGIIKCESTAKGPIKSEFLRNLAFRIYALAYNPRSNQLYASTSNGLIVVASDGSFKPIYYQNQALYPSALCFSEDRIHAALKSHGILEIKNNHVTSVIHLASVDKGEVFSKIRVLNERIIARSFRGLFQFDLQGRLINVLSASQGFSGNRVIDFAISGDSLWVAHTNGVQLVNLARLPANKAAPQLFISEVLLNDSTRHAPTEAIPSNQRKIQFVLSVPTLRSREAIRYHYKLEGTDAQWSVNDASSNQVTYNALAPGQYTFLAKAEKQGLYSAVVSYPFTIQAPLYKQWWFITGAVLLFMTTVYSLYKWQLNAQRVQAQRVNELNASRLTAIQSQMNPHFIFNSLNSIQNLILKGDVEHSYSYISTFSDLVRRTLSYSDKDFIDVEQEIKLIEIYLSLEKLRFKKDFEYSIDTGGVADIQIPPMLIQPFIENALAHGLLHKKGEKKLSIRFVMEKRLTCVIQDNGIGRERARAIKQRQGSAHESFSVSAIRKRFEILSVIFHGEFGFRYEDLVNEKGEAAGTRVVVILPTRHKF